MTVGSVEVAGAIRECELENSVLAVHSSLRSFGHLDGGPETLVSAFLEAGCTLVVPTFTYECAVMRPQREIPQNGWEADYESDEEPQDYSPTGNIITRDMGAIPASILRMPARIRGRHPIDSLSAIGPFANEIIDTQDSLNIFGPYKWMYSWPNAHLVLIGVGFDRATPIHFAEEQAGRQLFRRWGKFEGQIVETKLGGCSEGFNRLRPSVAELEKSVMVGQSRWLVFPFREFVDRTAAAIAANSEITHCEDEGCVRCRDAVRGGPIILDG